MNNLELKITGDKNLENSEVFIDDKPVKLKKNEFKNITGSYQTEQEKIKLEIFKYPDVGGIWWFVIQLLFFVISIFGILDVRSKNRAVALNYSAEVELKEDSKLTLRLNPPKNSSKGVEVESDLQINEDKNEYFIDDKSKKTLKILKISKIILAVVLIAVTTIVLAVTLK